MTTTSRLTIIDNRVTSTVELRLDREISFDTAAPGKSINVTGKWGRVVSEGMLVDSIKYSRTIWKGINSHKEVMAEMEYRKSKLDKA